MSWAELGNIEKKVEHSDAVVELVKKLEKNEISDGDFIKSTVEKTKRNIVIAVAPRDEEIRMLSSTNYEVVFNSEIRKGIKKITLSI